MNFKLFNTTPKPLPIVAEVAKKIDVQMNSAIINTNYNTPYCSVYRGSYGYVFGDAPRNLYPQQLLNFYASSPMHQNAINYKSMLTSGEGLEFNTGGLDINKQIEAEQLKFQLNKVFEGITLDYYLHARYALLIHWNEAFTKIIKIERVSAEKVRIYDIDEELNALTYIVCQDWRFVGSKFKTTIYPKFDIHNKKDRCQLFEYMVETPGKLIYNLPTYSSGLEIIALDASWAASNAAMVNNMVAPSLVASFYNVPDTQEKADAIRQSMVDSFGGPANRGRVLVSFSPDKETSPEFKQLDPPKMDSEFLGLSEIIEGKILAAHSINKELLGLGTSSSLGDSGGKMEILMKQFKYSTIRPTVKNIEMVFNHFSSINGLGNIIKIKEVNI